MANYKTPGVYIEEISKFPPSVAQVETAIPAFIGYTEKAEQLNGDTLHLEPTRIISLLEYVTYFGKAADETTISVDIDDATDIDGDLISRTIKVHQPSTKQPYLMYYSLQMYFANGGGPCYITSVGQYGDNPERLATGVKQSELAEGLTKIEKEDEPTLLVYPDGTQMGDGIDAFYGLYNLSLAQCLKLQDRFTLMDLWSDEDARAPIAAFRGKIANEGELRKYGAAYFPYTQTILDYQYSENGIIINHTSTVPRAVPDALISLDEHKANMSTVIGDLFDGTDPALFTGLFTEAIDYIYNNNSVSGFGLVGSTVGDASSAKSKSFAADTLVPLVDELGKLIDLKSKVVNDTNSVIASVVDDVSSEGDALLLLLPSFTADFGDGATDNKIEHVYKVLSDLIPIMKKAKVGTIAGAVTDAATSIENILAYTFTPEVLLPLPVVPANYSAPAPNLLGGIVANIDLIITAVDAVKLVDTNNGPMNGRVLGTIEGIDNATYNKIKLEIAALPMTLPPSSTMAGIYARVDSTRGVWKAPANVGLNYVIKPSLQISHDEQADMNVTTSGKSVNAIRTFTGKGTLVWGARTLAGNDNEWRYINVRRFFNMVEESVGKATEQFVFEGNDANTWVRVRAMIENFLILQWKAGALAGAKAEQAFYVRVGLGQTMTAQDILEGRMIIEIGMAAVRPAEFIILRFSHKMQEA